MPETYGLPEPEPTTTEQAQLVVAEAVAGRSLVRTVLLYVAVGLLAVSPLPALAIVPLLLLMASDQRLA